MQLFASSWKQKKQYFGMAEEGLFLLAVHSKTLI